MLLCCVRRWALFGSYGAHEQQACEYEEGESSRAMDSFKTQHGGLSCRQVGGRETDGHCASSSAALTSKEAIAEDKRAGRPPPLVLFHIQLEPVFGAVLNRVAEVGGVEVGEAIGNRRLAILGLDDDRRLNVSLEHAFSMARRGQ